MQVYLKSRRGAIPLDLRKVRELADAGKLSPSQPCLSLDGNSWLTARELAALLNSRRLVHAARA